MQNVQSGGARGLELKTADLGNESGQTDGRWLQDASHLHHSDVGLDHIDDDHSLNQALESYLTGFYDTSVIISTYIVSHFTIKQYTPSAVFDGQL